MRRQLTIRLAALVVVLAAGVAKVSAQSFTVDDIKYTLAWGKAHVSGYVGPGGHVTIPSFVKSPSSGTIYDVTEIANRAFSGCTSITSIDLPGRVTAIGNYAFKGCTCLTFVDFPDGLTSIGDGAFEDCTVLTSIDLPDGLTRIGEKAFSGCTGLTSIVASTYNCEVGRNAFCNTNIRCAVFLSNSLVGCMPFSAECEVFAFGDELLRKFIIIKCGKLYTFQGKDEVDSSNRDELVSLSVAGLDTCAYTGKPRELSIEGNTSQAEIKLLDNETAVDAGTYTVDELTFSFRYYKYDIYIPEVRVERLSMPMTCTISKAPLNVSVSPSSATITYGESCPDFEVEYDGFVNGEGEEVLSSLPTVAYQSYPDAGTHRVIASGGEARNYDINYIASELTVNKAPLTVACGNHTVTYGDKLPKFKLKYDGFVLGEDEGVLSAFPVAKCPDGSYPDAGKHPLTISGGRARNYDFEYVDGELTVEKAILAVTGESYTVTYGDELPEFVYDISGFVLGEDEGDLDALPVVRTISNPSGGEHTLDISGGKAKNYGFDYIPGTLTVLKASQSIEWGQDFASGLDQGDLIEMTAVATSGIEVKYESTNSEVAEVLYIGGIPYLSCVNRGSANIIATQPGDGNWEEATPAVRRVNVGHGSGLHDASSLSIGCRPSPALDVLEVTGTSSGMACAVYDLSGALVLSSRCADGATLLDVSRLAPGAYVLVVAGGDGAAAARLRFAKE